MSHSPTFMYAHLLCDHHHPLRNKVVEGEHKAPVEVPFTIHWSIVDVRLLYLILTLQPPGRWGGNFTFQSDDSLLLFASVTLSRICQTSLLLWLLRSRPVLFHSCSRSQYEVWMAQVYEEWCQQEQATLNSWGTYLPTCVVHPSRAMRLDGCCGEKERGRDGEEEGAIPVRYQAA